MPIWSLILIIVGSFLLILLFLFFYQGYRYSDLFFSYKYNPKESKRKPLTSPDKSQVLFYDKKWFNSLPFEEINIKGYDGINLHGYYYRNPTSNKLLITVHGYRGTYLELSQQAHYFEEELGYSVLLIDQRAQGESGGKFITFGEKERRDVLSWCNKAVEENKDVQIVLLGFSMGAATVLMSLSLPLPSNVKCIIADSSYTSTKDELTYIGKNKYKKGYFTISNSTRVMAYLRCHFSYNKYSPLKSLKEEHKIPVMLIQGQEDTYVPFAMGRKLKENTNKRSYLETFSVKGAWHGMSYQLAKDTYQQKVKSFTEKFVH